MLKNIVRPVEITYAIPVELQTLVATDEDVAFELEKEFMEHTEKVFNGTIKSWDCIVSDTERTFCNLIWEEI